MAKTLHEAVTVHVDDVDGIATVAIWLEMGSNRRELVYASDTGGEQVGVGIFSDFFASTARNVVTDGFEYVFARIGGWRSDPIVIHVVTTDAVGGIAVSQQSFPVTLPAVLAVSSFVPTPGLLPGDVGAFSSDPGVAKNTPITFTVRSAAHVLIALRYKGSLKRYIVYDDGFQEGFVGFSSVVVSDVDQNFSVIPAGGWQGSIDCLSVIAVDDLGNVVNFGDE